MKKDIVLIATALAAVFAEAGRVSFEETSVSVKESAEYAELHVTRKGTDVTRVRYATVSGTARPGLEYYATNGVIKWAAKESTTKKIKVRLMPDLVPTWESNKTFKVVLSPLEADELGDGEKAAEIVTPTAKVKLTEVSKKAPGTVSATAWVNADYAEVPFANASKPALKFEKNGMFGETAIRLSRTGGVNGAVRVKVKAVNSSAKVGTDFWLINEDYEEKSSMVVEWADGDAEPRWVTICAIDDETDVTPTKKFSLSLSAVEKTGYAKPTIGTPTVTCTERNALVGQTLSAFAKTVSGAGVTVSGSESGDWYLNEYGSIICVPFSGKKTKTLTIGLTGPGFFATDSRPDYDSGPISYKYSYGTRKNISADDMIELLLPSGQTTVKFVLKGTGTGARGVTAELVASDAPFLWVPLSKTTPSFPRNKAVVLPSVATNLAWSVPLAAEDIEGEDGLRYRVVMDTVKDKLDKSPSFVAETVGKTVALGDGATVPGKTYYWRVDYVYGPSNNLQTVKGKSVWSFSLSASDTAPATFVASGTDINGDEAVQGRPVVLYQGVKTAFGLGVEGGTGDVTLSLVSGKLPDGLKLKQSTATKAWKVSGTPTTAGTYNALIGGKIGKKTCATTALSFEVKPIRLGAGTFTAVLKPERGSVENTAMTLAKVSFTATSAGKLSAKVSAGGKSYSFSGTGYTSVEPGTDGVEELEPDAIATLTARLENVQKINKVSYTNVLTLTVADAVKTNLYALGATAGRANLTFCVPSTDGKSAEREADGEGILYSGDLYRDNSKLSLVAAQLAAMKGYYTVALAPQNPQGGAPEGCGYLTFTVDAKGVVKTAGKLADGTSVSFSGMAAAFIGDLTEGAGDQDVAAHVLLHKATSKMCFGGNVRLVRTISDIYDEAAQSFAVVDPDKELYWGNGNTKAAYDVDSGTFGGFQLALTPTGGWYDKIVNLQAYYRKSDVSVDVGDAGIDGGLPDGVFVRFAGNTPKVAKSAGVTLSLKRATGVLTGTLSYTVDGKTSTGLNHEGVMLMSGKDVFGRDADVLSAGFFLRKVKVGKETVSLSLPFFLLSEMADPDFAAGDLGDYAGEEVPEAVD